ncbi:sensor histidine kinase [Streptomyces sp. NPDC007861]|uniref:sensor histidine kinase n=1 Tax=Streptomyces sp. NPDC007861 TaxID=3154893 RepID=UPI0033CBC05E
MSGDVLVRVKGWSGRSGLAKVDLYTRGTVYLLMWVAVVGLTLIMLTRPVRSGAPLGVVIAAPLLGAAVGVVCTPLVRHAMDAYLGQGTVPRRLLFWAAAVTAATVGAVLWLAASVPSAQLLRMALWPALVPFVTAHCLIVRRRTTVLVHAGVLAVLGALIPLTGKSATQTLVTLITVAFAVGWVAFTARISMWVLAVMWELREARDVQARLAVAEERLRFGRDLHDVLGRNLAVIALKSELAVQLARRGRPEAVDQMVEVQRTARESQREVRDVVRGYRAADLHTELAGAQGVLTAAGITCAIGSPDGAELGLPGEVQSALAWVVREATTNVLRHGEPTRCTIALAVSDGAAVLTVENDGVRGWGGGEDEGLSQGSGLAGLRERLAALGGTLDAGGSAGGCFRLTATVPVPVPVPEPTQAGRSRQDLGGLGRLGGLGGLDDLEELEELRDLDALEDRDGAGDGAVAGVEESREPGPHQSAARR